MPWRKSLSHLHQARNESQKAIEGLEKAAEALRHSMEGNQETMEGNQSSESSPVRQRHLDAIATRLVNAHAEQAEVKQLIEELERKA
jgi:ribosomal protein S7